MMQTRHFELSFEVLNLTEAVEDAIDAVYDAVFSSHDRTAVVTLLVPGKDAVDAASSAIAELRRQRVDIRRLVDDLVTRAEIAARAQVTTQAVGLWVRGERNGSSPFPQAYVLAGNATLWLWGEVVAYLRSVGSDIDEDVEYPSRTDILRIAALLAPDPRDEGDVVCSASGVVFVSARREFSAQPLWSSVRESSVTEYRAAVVGDSLVRAR